MNNFNLEDMLRASGNRLKADIEERLILHPGELGTDREEIIRQFLRAFLPKRFDISTGFVFDSSGNVSKQVDIIISDSMACPRFETVGGCRFYPCESVIAVGQVKSSLKSQKELQGALENLSSVKSLDRSAGGTAIDLSWNEFIDHRQNQLHQIFTFIFIVGDALSAKTMRKELFEHVFTTEPHLWPNIIFGLNKFLITFCCDIGICPNPMDARGIAIQFPDEKNDLLMKFYLLLGGAIEVTRVSYFPYWKYLETVTTWSAEVEYSCADDPPPYLSSLMR